MLSFIVRFDLMAKFLYIKYREKEVHTAFFKNLYHKHLITFNNCWEYPGTKMKIEDFFKEFNILIDSIKKNGFDNKFPILIGKNDIIVNGIHRLITCYYYKKQPIFKQLEENGNIGYNSEFFLNRQPNVPLDRLYADRMALEYIKFNKNIRTMVVYPTGYNNIKINNIKDIIKSYGYLYYEKQVLLNDNGLNNLIKEMYRGEEWIGGLFPNGINPGGKYIHCMEDNPITLFLIHMNDLSKCVELKKKCRGLYNIGKHSLHISDYTEDTFRIGASLLNENSIHYLNNGTNDITSQTKQSLVNYFNKVGGNNEDFCLTSSLIMEMYGLRQAKDIDYLNKDNIEINLKNVGLHSEIWEEYYNVHKDEIIYNPENHFYFNGFKFATLGVIKKMKIKRGEPKDLNDIKLIINK